MCVSWCGQQKYLECLIACFEKDCVLMAYAKDGHLSLSVNKVQALTVFEELASMLSESRAVIS